MPPIYSIVEFVIILIIAGVCGGLARAMFGLGNENFLLSVGVGVLGGYIGLYLAQYFGLNPIFTLPIGTTNVQVVWIMVCLVILTFIVSLIDSVRHRGKKRPIQQPK